MTHSHDHECNCGEQHNQNEEIYNYIHNEISAITEQIKLLDSNIVQLMNALEAIEGLKDSHDDEILMPLANGIFFKVKSIKNSTLLVNVGSEVFVHKNIPEVEKLLADQVEELKKNKEILMQQYNQSLAMLNQFETK